MATRLPGAKATAAAETVRNLCAGRSAAGGGEPTLGANAEEGSRYALARDWSFDKRRWRSSAW